MKFGKYISIFIAQVLLSTIVLAQDTVVLSFKEYMGIVREHHPLSKTADLKIIEGDMSVRQARGGFDPEAYGDFWEKRYTDVDYYQLFDGGLKVPTWYGVEFSGGFQQNSGDYLNPMDNTPEQGFWYAGISVPVAQGLFIDKRRAELRKAQMYQKMTEQERRLILNDLLYNAGQAYWDWFIAYNNLLVYSEALEIAQLRFDAVKQSAALGDRPSIDTLEAGIQVQNRKLSFQQAQLDFKNQTAFLSVYLWRDGRIPLEPAPNTIPLTQDNIINEVNSEVIVADRDSLISSHPELQRMAFKIQGLKIENRWMKEQLKPTLNLKYNLLTTPTGPADRPVMGLNDYTFGVQFNFPILLRQERGAVRLADLKIKENEYSLASKRADLLFKVTAAFNELNTTGNQIDLYSGTVRDYLGLLTGERVMFEAGESSLFMVNSRELGYINARVKLVELIGKNRKAGLKAEYSLALLE